MTGRTIMAVALAVSIGSLPGRARPQESTPAVRAARVHEPITLDGRLDEPAWQTADPISDLRQREPLEGAPATEPTSVRILYDEQNLYIGISAGDSAPGEVVARILERDGLAEFGGFGDLTPVPDDMVAIVLDTYHDRRNGYLFATNAVGNQTDALIEDEGQDINEDWDGIWDVAALRTDQGWSVEIAIPFRTLRFPGAEAQIWGFNVARLIKRKNEEVLWSSWGRDNGGLFKIARAGDMTGVLGLRQGANVQVEPYVLGRARDADRAPDFDESEEIEVGGDAKWGITPNLTFDLTVNTDFAQVEADVEQINLTRFSLFFPEKREFFLENAGIFQFGVQDFGPPPLLVFFSRRIGIGAGREIPLLGGARLTGRTGPWSIGVLDVVTGEEAAEPRANWTVARVRRNVLARGQVGGILTHVNPAEGEGSTAFGADFRIQPTNKLVLWGMAAGNDDPAAPSEPYAANLVVDYTGEFWGWQVNGYSIGEGMRPAAGFVRRTGIHRGFATLRQRPRPGGLVRSITIRETVELFVSTGGTVEDRSFSASVEPLLESGDQLSLRAARRSERLFEPFELRADLVIPPGEYWNSEWSIAFETARKRPLWMVARYGEPGFFDGDRRELEGEVGWTPSPHLGLSLGWSHNRIETPHGTLETDLGILRLGVARSTHLRGDALVQYNGETEELSGNLRFHWIWSPGSDLYLVADLRREQLGDRSGPMTRAIVLKLTRLVWF